MLSIASTDPSPLAQAVVYMTGIFLGYALLTPSDELRQMWKTVRSTWSRHKD